MKIKMIVAALLLCISVPALAQFTTIAEAYEVRISDVRLPQNELGTIAFKKCSECDYETRRTSRATVWEFNGERMSLEKFRRALATVDRSENIPVQVLHHLESNQVTKVWIRVP
jgi:hypothetical protein